ncbi:hypothetical protein H6F90_18300 [Trichocoleus sp. FACHB-591]|uniref:hypothetical protein n=1 Tax=Trichocoleus sp. FACHB-591 TaxID=2692872 RepID=UPI001682CB10|nr:hypothetical protein [Trichocoleus sp. FACHB-591]MBD2097054.1 hypothetical protein [Trichocoleus sp. FACHB-591]
MIQPQSSLVVPMLASEAIECLEGELVAETEEFDPAFDFAAIAKTVLKLSEPIAIEGNSQPLVLAQPVAQPVLEAMQQLVAIVAKLRSPQSGWPSDLEPTIENLIPYVTEEAYEVLEALQTSSLGSSSGPVAPAATATLPDYFLIEDLIPQWLWYIAKSSYDLMRLLCGVEAKVFQPGQGWQTGALRLVALLTLKLPHEEWALDLATNQPPVNNLTHQALVQTEGENFCNQPTWAQRFTQQLLQQMQTVTPEMQRFTEPTAVDCLQSGQAWQSGTLQLQFAFEFTEGTTLTDLTAPNGISAFGTALKVKLTEPAIAQAYFQTQLQPLSVAIAHATAAPEADSAATDLSGVLLPSIVATAEAIAKMIPNATELAPDGPLQPEICVDGWLPQLLWQLTSSSYQTMHLVGGVPAEVLQPDEPWLTGTLRLFAVLAISAPHLNWLFDLSTGQVLKTLPNALAAQTLIRVSSGVGGKDLQPAATFLTQLLKPIEANTPLLQQLLQGTPIALQPPVSDDWSAGHLQLKIGFELISDSVT